MSKPAPRFGKGAAKKGAAKPAAAAAAKPAVPLPQTPQQLEAVLAALLAPDTAAITAATEVINAFMKQSAALPALMQQVAHSSVMESRQMAAVLLRRCITKLWKGLKPAEKTEVVSHTIDTPRTRAHRAALRTAHSRRCGQVQCADCTRRPIRVAMRSQPLCNASLSRCDGMRKSLSRTLSLSVASCRCPLSPPLCDDRRRASF